MNKESIKALLIKYHSGKTTDDDMMAIEGLLERDLIDLNDLDDVKRIDQRLNALETPSPSLNLDDRFYSVLAEEKKKLKPFSWSNWFQFSNLWPQLSLATITLLIGIGIGYILMPSRKADNNELQALSKEVTNLKEMMMLSLLQQESATERLKAVSLTHEFDASKKVTEALIQTLNNDKNINVRLAALEALKPYTDDSEVRTLLVQSIAKQDSPLVQVALAELMAQLQVKSSVKEFEKLLDSERTPQEVKKKIKESIERLV
jgi:hypothetical protein